MANRTKCPDCGKLLNPQGMGAHRRIHNGNAPKAPKRTSLNAYLTALTNGELVKPRGGVTIERLQEQIVAAQEAGQLLKAVKLIENRRLKEVNGRTDHLEEYFVANALAYSDEHGISYAAWRELGVPARVLKAAGVS